MIIILQHIAFDDKSLSIDVIRNIRPECSQHWKKPIVHIRRKLQEIHTMGIRYDPIFI